MLVQLLSCSATESLSIFSSTDKFGLESCSNISSHSAFAPAAKFRFAQCCFSAFSYSKIRFFNDSISSLLVGIG